MAVEEGRPIGYVELIRRSANFRNLWYAQIVSLLGDWFSLIGSAALIAILTGSGLAVGGLFIARMLPSFVLSPVTGVIADRYNKKALLIWADLLRAVLMLGFLLVREPGHVWLLYTLTILVLSISAQWQPTYSALLPEIVEPDELVAANALLSSTWSSMLAIGAALGGLAAGLIGIYAAFAIDAFTFLVSAWFTWRIVYQAGAPSMASSVIDGLRQYVEGLRYLWGAPDILAISLVKAASALTVGGGLSVLQVRFAQQIFPLGEGGSISLGLIYATVGVGTGLGPLVARRVLGDNQRATRWAIAGAFILSALGMVVVSVAPTLPVLLIGMFFRAVGVGINWVFSAALLLLLLPKNVRGRVFAFEFAIFTLATATGSGVAGWLLDTTSLTVRQLSMGMALFVLLPAVLWAGWQLVSRGAAAADTAPEPA